MNKASIYHKMQEKEDHLAIAEMDKAIALEAKPTGLDWHLQ